ncbi:DUF1654 domain-containing protein [Pseudomonas sp. JS3066]|uniref:DUF1654 domain-containing protein n=1 Tax=Pseudomonas sp. JS3066 TaxID=3090665 RepID=UPI002E7AED02|nr:DUF1654 domain-containing protein [Pseudomonas sp. JS3066]WVK90930.1 DUF1654 domain-containing protein [Pseudomonas sp. JS3066]
MAKQKTPKQSERRELTGLEKLGLRVSAMINSPKAQAEHCVTVHRLDTDSDEAWNAVIELLAEEDGIDMTFNDDGSVKLRWHLESENDQQAEELAPVDEMVVQNLAEAPF